MNITILSKTLLSDVERQLVKAAIHQFRLSMFQLDAMHMIEGTLEAMTGNSGRVPESREVRHEKIRKAVEEFANNAFDGLTIALEWEPSDLRDPIRDLN